MTSALVFPWAAFPGADPSGALTQVAPGLFWARLPLPFRLDHVNVWLIAEADGWTVIDTGCDTPQVRRAWEGLFAGPMAGRPARRLIATHGHVDHIGLAGWLCDRFDCPMAATLVEWVWARLAHDERFGGASPALAAYLRRGGLATAEAAEQMAGRSRMIALATPLPGAVTELRHGETLRMGGRDWQVIVTGGHAFAHASFYDAANRVLIAGDQLLPRISPVVAVFETTPNADPLGDFLASFDAFRHLPEDTLVLPSHGLPYRGLAARVAELRAHHRERLARTLSLLDTPASARDIVAAMFPNVADGDGVGFALGEVLAHLNRLVAAGQADADLIDGVLRYRRAARDLRSQAHG